MFAIDAIRYKYELKHSIAYLHWALIIVRDIHEERMRNHRRELAAVRLDEGAHRFATILVYQPAFFMTVWCALRFCAQERRTLVIKIANL